VKVEAPKASSSGVHRRRIEVLQCQSAIPRCIGMANGAVSLNELNLALGRHRSTKWQPSDQTSQAGRKNHPRPKLLLEFGMVLFLAAIDHLRRAAGT